MQVPAERADDVLKLLNCADGSVPGINIDIVLHKGRSYFAVDDLLDWLSRMADSAVPDQKQEVYRGLREYLYLLSKS